MPTVENDRKEDILRIRYLKTSKIILLIAVLYSIWIAFIIMSVYFLGFGNKWAFFTMDQWILSNVVLLGVFVGLELIFVLHHYIVKEKRIEREKPIPLYYKGRKLHMYTLPEGSKGGIFSKTFIKIDESKVLNLRYQMMPPNELWGRKEQ